MAKRETSTGGRSAAGGVIPGRWVLSVGNPGTPVPPGFSWRMLTDLARLESGHTPSRRHSEYWGGKIPWIGIRDATQNHGSVLTSTNEAVTQAGIDNSSARVLPAGTVCLSRTASVGYTVMMGQPMATSQDFVNWVCGPELNPRYLMYLMMLEQESVRRFAHGTTHQTMYYPEAKALHVAVPDRAAQDRVVGMLGALDELIEANARLADSCAGLRRVLVARALSSTTNSVPLSSTAQFINGKNFTKDADGLGRPVIRTPEIRRGPDSSTVRSDAQVSSQFIADPGDILFVWSGSLMVQRWQYEQGLINQHIFKVIPNPGVPAWLVFGLLEDRMPSFLGLAADKATTMGHIKRGDLEVPVPMPNLTEIPALDQDIRPLWDQELELRLEIRQLTQTRDELLPLLMSGRASVDQVVAA